MEQPKSQIQELIEAQNTIIQRRGYLPASDKAAQRLYILAANQAASRFVASYCADELTAYLTYQITAKQFFHESDETMLCMEHANKSDLELENLLVAEIDLQLSYYEEFTELLTKLQFSESATEEAEPASPPEGTRPFTFGLTYTATYSSEITVYAKDEDEALGLAQEQAPDPCGDDLASNCECDYELQEDEDED